MALVEPLIGHLLSKYRETVLEGLSKINSAVQANDEQGTALATAITQQEEALQALRATLLKADYFLPTTKTLTVVLAHLSERGSRVALVREVLRGDCAALFRKTLATLSDASLSHVIAALQFLTAAVKDAPLLVLARLRSPVDGHSTAPNTSSNPTAVATQRSANVPLHLAAFRLQLTYGQRRIRLVRLGFLVQLITSPMNNAAAEMVCSHGVVTHLLEDAAELLREGTSAGLTCSMDALRVVRERFVHSRDITSVQKRCVLLAQRNIFRLLVRALEFEPVADHAAAILYAIVDETIESPADYASTRVESLEDHGMPNYLLFFLLRQLRPKANERMAELVLHILQRAPDLIRPYFIRVSGHLAEEGSTHGVAPTTARVAVINLMTRAFLCPMPYHLAAIQVQLEPVAAKTSTFYTMCPRDVADEICPAWVAEYVHSLINGSTNLLLLTLAMQMTQAALMRAKCVLPLVHSAQRAAELKRSSSVAASVTESENHSSSNERVISTIKPVVSVTFSKADLAVLHGSDDVEAEVWDTYNAQVRHHLQAALPSREEFWHRMTQQVHLSLTTTATTSTTNNAVLTKVHVVTQRMLLLMKSYVDVFDVRSPWLSAVPIFLPHLNHTLEAKEMDNNQKTLVCGDLLTSFHPITVALQQQNDILRPWPATSVAILCQLLVASYQRRVPMVKLHHVNMSQAQGIGEWPLLLSILLWVTHHREQDHGVILQQDKPGVISPTQAQEMRAVGWAAQLLLWTVHSVTIHSTCTLAEAHLWLSCLTPNTLPVFLHVLNHLLMRSLSKAADRVTHELREASCGVLVAAAQHFIERTKEKQQQKGGAVVEEESATSITGPRGAHSVKPPKAQGKRDGKADEVGANLWGTHLQAALSEFEDVVKHVTQLWTLRDALLSEANARIQRDKRAHRVTQQQCVDVLVLADRQRGFAKAADQAATSAVQQLRIFAHTLHSPVLPRPENEVEMTLLTQLHTVTDVRTAEMDAVDDAQYIGAALGLNHSNRNIAGTASAAPRWYAMNSVCWHVAGLLIAMLNRSEGMNAKGEKMYAAVHSLALGLVRAVLACRSDVELIIAAASNAHDTSTIGLLVLLLACVRALLSTTEAAVTAPAESESLSQDEVDALGAVCLSSYTGGLSVQDRICYAVCLSLHYLCHAPMRPSSTASTAAPKKQEARAVRVGNEGADGTPTNKQHYSGHKEQNEKRGGNDEVSSYSDTVQQRYVFHGAMVPEALVRRRFLLAGHTASALRTAEVEMLSWHLDTLTEEDITCMALCVSSRLHNGLLVRHELANNNDRKNNVEDMVDAAEDLLCAVYPELHGVEDVGVADLDQLTSSNILDLRYFVPLLHRVAALPPAYLEHLSTGRVIPLLLKSLTSIDPPLRTAAAAALATLYIPKGALRIVVGVARLKLRQLATDVAAAPATDKIRKQKTNFTAARQEAAVPRLPTPLAVFLITAIRPLGRYEDVLHHHLIHFLLHIESALATPVPFIRWTTAPPLTAVSVPLMLEKQEALQQRTHKLGGSGVTSSIAQASAADAAQELRKGSPPQLEFLLRLLRHGCEVPQDGAALLESDSVNGLMLLCDLLTASDALRASYVRCLLDLCTRSAALTRLFAKRGNALVWAVSFLWELCREYGVATPHPYSGLTFTTTLRLLRVLCVSTQRTPRITADAATVTSAAGVSAASVDQLTESLRQLRRWVESAHVTARDILDAFDEMIALCERTLCSPGKVENSANYSTSPVDAAQASVDHGKRHRENADLGAAVGEKRAVSAAKRVKADRVK